MSRLYTAISCSARDRNSFCLFASKAIWVPSSRTLSGKNSFKIKLNQKQLKLLV